MSHLMERFSDKVTFVVILRQPKPQQNHAYFLLSDKKRFFAYNTKPGCSTLAGFAYACYPNRMQMYFLYKPIYNLPFQVKSPSPAEIVIGHLQGQSL